MLGACERLRKKRHLGPASPQQDYAHEAYYIDSHITYRKMAQFSLYPFSRPRTVEPSNENQLALASFLCRMGEELNQERRALLLCKGSMPPN